MPPNSVAWLRRLHPLRRLRALGVLLLRNVPRVYSAALIVLIGTLTYQAVSYLVTSLAVEAGPPPQISELPARLSPDVLQTDWASWRALSATEHARSPLAHYHRVDQWIEHDSFNDCTRSGCHAALPHSRRKEVRAFLNMHATSMHCGVCHMNISDRPLPLTWYDLKTGKPCDPPSLLAALDMLTNEAKRDELIHASPDEQDAFVDLLRRSAKAAGSSTTLEKLADHFAALRPGSKAFVKLVEQAQASLPEHFRGEYGAKLAVRDDQGRPRFGHPDTEAAKQAWFARAQPVTDEVRARLLKAVHPLKRPETLHCTDCHTAGAPLLDLSQVGYPAARREMLAGQIVVRMIEHINAGQPMHMPNLINPLGTRATSQPALNDNPSNAP